MARQSSIVPAYLHHKATGQARCRIAGKDHYLGPYGSESSRIKYGELIAKLAGGMPIDPLASPKRTGCPANAPEPDPGPTVGKLCLVFLRHPRPQTHHHRTPRNPSRRRPSQTDQGREVRGVMAVNADG